VPTAVELRRAFLRAFLKELMVVWPVLSGLALAQLALGMVVGFVEDWRISDSAYFAFVTGLTIGYGDLVPRRILGRVLALLIGFIGILLTGLIAAVGVRALQLATQDAGHRQDGEKVRGRSP
jgi:hypothetical protein